MVISQTLNCDAFIFQGRFHSRIVAKPHKGVTQRCLIVVLRWLNKRKNNQQKRGYLKKLRRPFLLSILFSDTSVNIKSFQFLNNSIQKVTTQ